MSFWGDPMMAAHQPWAITWAAWCFRGKRADYYEFLAQYLTQTNADRTLLDIFQQDAQRHGLRSARGRLAAWWAHRFPACGGDLAQSWQGCLPMRELHCLSVAQSAGQPALLLTLQALAEQIRLTQKSTRHFWQTIATGLVALGVALATVMLLPLYAAPKLTQAFSVVPVTLYGIQTQRLIDWTAWLSQYGLPLLGFVGLSLYAWIWSFAHLVGLMRRRLDRFGPWRLYRDMQAIQFLTMTSTLLRSLELRGVTLRGVLVAQQSCANPWVGWHLQQMMSQIDSGLDPLDALDTGLLNEQTRWCLLDVIRVRGLSEGLTVASTQIGEQLTATIARQAVCWRWLLLIMAVGTVFAVGVWHIEVIEEMRRALTLVYGS